MIQRHLVRQRDFSAGELDESMMRRDDAPLMRAGARRALNKRLTASGAIEQRPGRQALFLASRRTEKIKILAEYFYLSFSISRITIYDSTTVQVFSHGGYLWAADDDIPDISWAQIDNYIIICFTGMRTKVLTYSGGTWTVADFAFTERIGGQRRTPFWRISPKGITLTPAGAPPTATSTIGDMTDTAHAFDGDGTTYAIKSASTTAYIGQGFSSAAAVKSIVVTVKKPDTLDGGFLTLTAYGKTSLPVSSTDGTVLATVTYDAGLESSTQTLTPSDQTSAYSYIWVLASYEVPIDLEIYSVDITTALGGFEGTINIKFSDDVLTADHVGTRLRYQGRQITIDSVADARNGTATINEKLLGGQKITLAVTGVKYNIGDVVDGDLSGAKGQVLVVGADYIDVVLLGTTSQRIFTDNESITGPTYEAISQFVEDLPSPPETDVWDDEVINDMRGWPGSVSVDQRRVIFADIPGVPGGIDWSAIDEPSDHYPGANPEDAIFEIVPNKARVFHVVPGNDELVFTETGIYYIPISETNPLKPGSVAFRPIIAETPARVRPVMTPNGMLYITAGLTQLMAITSAGQATLSYIAREAANFHQHLLVRPRAIAVSGGTDQVTERYFFITNDDGTVAVGRYDSGRDWIGIVPWEAGGGGSVTWVSALESTVLFTTEYHNGNTRRRIVEQVDETAWLDAQVTLNSEPPALDPPAGMGPLWFFAEGTVHVMDGRRYLGTRSVDVDGNLVELPGEDLSGDGIIAGLAWSETLTPFIPQVGEGQSVRQTMRRRRVAQGAVTVQNSSGFLVAGRRVPPYRFGDNEEDEPTLREEMIRFKKLGRGFDPQIDIVKDIPGPLRIIEFAVDVGV